MDFQCTHEIFLQAGYVLVSPWQFGFMTATSVCGVIAIAALALTGMDRVLSK